MLLIILGYFLLPSLAEGSNKAFTCSPGPLAATCDAGKVILINQVRRGYYTGAFNGSHCKYQVGDSIKRDDGNSKEVWQACNLQSTCSVPFIQSGNYYLEMDYECVYKSNLDMLDICKNGSGMLLVSKHGYFHSPCYPNLSAWTDSTGGFVFCQCSGTFQPPVKAEDLTISVFHTFQETDSLEIRWHAVTNPPETLRSTSPSFKSEQRYTGSFYLAFYSSYRGSDGNRGFWLEFKANSALEFKCSNKAVPPLTCEAPNPPPTTTTTITTTTTPTSTKPKTTTTTPISTTATTTTTAKPTTTSTTASTTSRSGGGLPGVKTTIPGTATTSHSSPTNATITVDGAQPDQRDTTAIAVGIIIPLMVIAAIVATVLVILRKRRQAAKAKSESNEDLAQNGSAMVDNASFVNPSFDPESGEIVPEPEEETDVVEDDPLSLYSLADEVVVQPEFGSPKDRAQADVLILPKNPYSDYDIVPIKPRPIVKPKPAPRKGSKKDAGLSDSEEGGTPVAVYAEVIKKANTGPASSSKERAKEDAAFAKEVSQTGPPKPMLKPKPAAKPRLGSQKAASPSDSEKGGNPVGAVSAEVAERDKTGPASSSTKFAEEITAYEKQVSKTGPPKPMPKPKPAAKFKLGSKSTTRPGEDPTDDVYTEVEKKGRGGKVGLGMKAPDGEYSEAEVVYATCGAGVGECEAEVEDEPGDDLYTEVNKSAKRRDRSAEPIADVNHEGVPENQTGDVYAQVDKTAKPPKRQKPKVPRRNIGGAQDASKQVHDDSSGDVYAQVQKGKKTAPPRGEASKYEHVNLDTNMTQDPVGNVSGFTDLYSSVDDAVTEALDNKGEDYSDGELYGPVDDDGELYGSVDDGGDGELYGSVDDDGDDRLYGHADNDGGCGGAYPDYGEVGNIQNGRPTDADDDEYDHAIIIANKFTGRQSGGGPPAPFELHDDTYDHVVLESVGNHKTESDTEV